MSKRNSPPKEEEKEGEQNKKIKLTPIKPPYQPNLFYSPQQTSLLLGKTPKENLKNSTLQVKFVNRENESEIMVNTIVENRSQQNRSETKLVSLFQTYGIGKTSLVRKFREVYECKNHGHWSDHSKWVKELQLFELDFRLFKPSNCVLSMSEEIANFVVWQYERQLVTLARNVSEDLLKKRQEFRKVLATIGNLYYLFDALNSHTLLPEGYLIFFDSVDSILHKNHHQLQDPKWNQCKEGIDLYLSRFLELWNEVMLLLIPNRSTIIFSGHVPVHLALSEKNWKGGSPSDFCLVYLSPMEKSVIQTMLEQSTVNIDNDQITISLLRAFELLGLENIEDFIEILVEYTGTVPRIMVKSFKSILKNLNDLSSKEAICNAFARSEQKIHDVTITIGNEEEANLLAHLYFIHSLQINIPSQTKLYFNKRHRNFIEILPFFKIHFQVVGDNVKIIIPKLLKDDILAKLSFYKTSISGVRYNLLQNNSILLDASKDFELSVIDLLVELLTLSFNKFTVFGDLCGGIFKETFFSNLMLPSNFVIPNIVIPGFSPNSTVQHYKTDMGFKSYLKPCYESFTSVLDHAMSRNEFCAAIPGEVNSGFDVLITLKTNANLLRKLVLFDMKLYEKNFTLKQLQEEINQAAALLPNYKVEEKPSLLGENLHFTLIMVVLGYSETVNQVIQTNSNESGSLLITGTCYRSKHNKLSYCCSNSGKKAWLKLKGGFEVLLLTENGLKNLLSNEIYSLFNDYSHKREEIYRKFVCCQFESSSRTGYLPTRMTASNIGSSLQHSSQSCDIHLSSSNEDTIENNSIALKLQRAKGIFQINSLVYDKEDCSEWTLVQIAHLLSSSRKMGGIGLANKKVDIEGYIFENILDALISFNGDKEAKIGHAVHEINCEPMVAESIVRWVFSNLLEYK